QANGPLPRVGWNSELRLQEASPGQTGSPLSSSNAGSDPRYLGARVRAQGTRAVYATLSLQEKATGKPHLE
ncbi:hypothetical protein P7K49_011893, partial [Saguinus oedipus]